MAYDPQSIDISPLRCVRGGNWDAPTFEDLLALMYRRSIATLETDPRDCIFGITGIVNAVARKLEMSYVPLKAIIALEQHKRFRTSQSGLCMGALD
jgi:hypothetical protein